MMYLLTAEYVMYDRFGDKVIMDKWCVCIDLSEGT